MRPISRAATIRELDRRMIEGVGLPAVALMEHAGHGCADAIRGRFPEARRARVLCGPGNNGGDGYVIARHLALAGWEIEVAAVHPPRTPEAQAHARVCEALGLLAPRPSEWRPELIVDAVFGTGQRGPVELPGVILPKGARLVAIDAPSGVDADTGALLGGPLSMPDFAVVIGRRKPWSYERPVESAFVDIGLERVAPEPPEALEEGEPATWTWERSADKWRRGHVGVRAGSPEMAGAAVLACMGALHGGAGLVTLFLDPAAWTRLGALPPEVMLQAPEALDAAPGARCDALVVGPGLGRGADEELIRRWREDPRPCVFDADALRALGALAEAGCPGGPRLLTPHVGEAAALLGVARAEVERDRFAAATRLGALCPTILKGPSPVVAGDGPLRVHPGGLPQLGTAGSGDVLAGACGALLAREGGPRSREELCRRASLAVAMHLAAGRGLPLGAGASDVARALRP